MLRTEVFKFQWSSEIETQRSISRASLLVWPLLSSNARNWKNVGFCSNLSQTKECSLPLTYDFDFVTLFVFRDFLQLCSQISYWVQSRTRACVKRSGLDCWNHWEDLDAGVAMPCSLATLMDWSLTRGIANFSAPSWQHSMPGHVLWLMPHRRRRWAPRPSSSLAEHALCETMCCILKLPLFLLR